MITGELKNKVDAIWDIIWTGGITSPITVLEQITYLLFMKLLDDNQHKREATANALGVKLDNPVFKKFYLLKIAQGKGHRCAQGHCVRKLLRIIYHLVITNQRFDPALLR